MVSVQGREPGAVDVARAGGRATAPGRRWIHRRGVLFRAELHPPAPSPSAAASASPAPGSVDEVRPALVRLSSTFGWPRPLPDWVGMGIHLLDTGADTDAGATDGCDRHDLLLVSSASGRDLWRQMRPVRAPLACSFSSVVRYRLGGADQVVAAIPAAPRPATVDQLLAGVAGAAGVATGQGLCPLAYRLVAAEEPRVWRPLGDLVLVEAIEDDPTVRFHPPAAGRGWVTRLRHRVYTWSRR